MTFGQALDAAAQGKKIRPKAWGNFNKNYVAFVDGVLNTHHSNGLVVGDWAILKGDWKSFPEWELWEEPGRDFQWAIQQLRAGQKVRRKDWDRKVALGVKSSYIFQFFQDGMPVNFYQLHLADVGATDWVLYEDPLP